MRKNHTIPDRAEDDWEVDIQACSSTDCTGLIPALPQTEEERAHYEELYPYIAKAHTPKTTS